jgi:hypothetical protein
MISYIDYFAFIIECHFFPPLIYPSLYFPLVTIWSLVARAPGLPGRFLHRKNTTTLPAAINIQVCSTPVILMVLKACRALARPLINVLF